MNQRKNYFSSQVGATKVEYALLLSFITLTLVVSVADLRNSEDAVFRRVALAMIGSTSNLIVAPKGSAGKGPGTSSTTVNQNSGEGGGTASTSGTENTTHDDPSPDQENGGDVSGGPAGGGSGPPGGKGAGGIKP